jgi:hypothetical protein
LPIVGFVCYKIGLRKRLQDNESQPILEQWKKSKFPIILVISQTI